MPRKRAKPSTRRRRQRRASGRFQQGPPAWLVLADGAHRWCPQSIKTTALHTASARMNLCAHRDATVSASFEIVSWTGDEDAFGDHCAELLVAHAREIEVFHLQAIALLQLGKDNAP